MDTKTKEQRSSRVGFNGFRFAEPPAKKERTSTIEVMGFRFADKPATGRAA